MHARAEISCNSHPTNTAAGLRTETHRRSGHSARRVSRRTCLVRIGSSAAASDGTPACAPGVYLAPPSATLSDAKSSTPPRNIGNALRMRSPHADPYRQHVDRAEPLEALAVHVRDRLAACGRSRCSSAEETRSLFPRARGARPWRRSHQPGMGAACRRFRASSTARPTRRSTARPAHASIWRLPRERVGSALPTSRVRESRAEHSSEPAAPGDTELGVCGPEMSMHRSDRDEQLVSDLLIRQAPCR